MKLKVTIQSLKVQHFRCFEEAFVQFHPHLNAIIGVNGAGKTALLEALAGLLQPLVARIRNENAGTIQGFSEKDIKNDRIESVNGVWAQIETTNSKNTFPVVGELDWYGTLDRKEYGVEALEEDNDYPVKEHPEEDLSRLNNIVKVLGIRLKDKEPVSLPVLAYYSCETADNPTSFEDTSSSKDYSEFTAFSAYKDALNRNSFNYQEFARWYKWQELVAKENRDEKIVKVVESAILQVISGERSQFEQLHTRYKNSPSGELVLSKNNLEVLVDQLSSGERMLFGLVGDLARRLVLANPGYDEPLKGAGVVLIDEIDLHLHPRWQRFILFKLHNIFPNIQFIATTHSPQVLQYVKPENIILLDNGEIVDATIRTFGKDSSLILREAFSVSRYSEEIPEVREVRDKVRRCFDLIDEEKYEEAEKSLKELEQVLGGNDPDIVELRTFLSLSVDKPQLE